MGHKTIALLSPDSRLPLVDGLRAAAAMLIVLHHFAIYGPVSRALAENLPEFRGALAEYARYAVYVFLVVAGFMAARTFADSSTRPVVPATRLILRRYLRLVGPLAAALMLAVFCAALARHWTIEDYVPGPASPRQVFAHLALLQSVLGFDSLTTGVWYIAVEMQLFIGVVLLLKVETGLPRRDLPVGAIALLTLASWGFWNGDVSLEDWAPYFFGAYGLGVLSWWAAHARLQGHRLIWMLVVLAALALLALDWRGRMAVALATALLLSRWGLRPWSPGPWTRLGSLRWLGERGYALFLVHFPVLLVVNTLVATVDSLTAVPPLLLLLAGAMASVLAASVFHACVEIPWMRLLQTHPAGRRQQTQVVTNPV